MHKSIIKKTKKKHYERVLLEKPKSNTTEVLISKTFIYSYISHDEFAVVYNVLKKCWYERRNQKNKEFNS